MLWTRRPMYFMSLLLSNRQIFRRAWNPPSTRFFLDLLDRKDSLLIPVWIIFSAILFTRFFCEHCISICSLVVVDYLMFEYIGPLFCKPLKKVWKEIERIWITRWLSVRKHASSKYFPFAHRSEFTHSILSCLEAKASPITNGLSRWSLVTFIVGIVLQFQRFSSGKVTRASFPGNTRIIKGPGLTACGRKATSSFSILLWQLCHYFCLFVLNI